MIWYVLGFLLAAAVLLLGGIQTAVKYTVQIRRILYAKRNYRSILEDTVS